MPSGHRPAPPVGTARVAISGHGEAGNTWVNVFWLNITATTHVVADLKSVVDSMAAAWASRFGGNLNTTFAQTGAKATWLYASGNSIEYTGSYSNTGSAGGSAMADNLCQVINWSISDYYRGGHPRTYIPGCSTVFTTNGRNLTATVATNLASNAGAFITDVNALTHGGISAVALGTVRFASGNAWLSPPVFRAYQGASARSVLGTQRRRLAAY